MSMGKKCYIIGFFLTATFVTFTLNNLFHVSVWQIYVKIGGETLMEWKELRCVRFENHLTQIAKPFRAFILQSCGTILERIRLFNAALNTERLKELRAQEKTKDWNISSNLQLVAEWHDDFLQTLSNYSQVRTFILPWILPDDRSECEWSSLNDSSNLLIREYYESTASEPLCTWIETPGKVEFSFDVINNWTCNRNTTKAVHPQSISFLALNAKPPYKGYYFPTAFPNQFFTELPRILTALYIVHSGVVSNDGDVFTKNMKLVPYACFPDAKLNPPTETEKFPIYEEVFVITQSYGDRVYHSLAETTPRIAVFLDFLLTNPGIKVHTPQDNHHVVKYIRTLGIDDSRIISGWCRAEIVYLPRATTCCFPHFLETQVLSLAFRQYMKKHFAPLPRNRLVFIRRTRSRYFNDQSAIERVVQKAALDYNLTFEVYRDNPGPSLHDTMRLFNSAVMVVAPHGAGMANLVFSEHGTFVIEGVCNRPHTNLFFQRTALVLGHRWHGIPSSIGCVPGVSGVVTIKPSIINDTVRTYLDYWAKQIL